MARFTKKKKLVALTAAFVVLAGGAAFAYWTAGGGGTGSADTGETSALVVNQTSVVSAMGPGVAPQNLSGNFDNPNGPTYVTSVTATIGAITGADGVCTAADYVITNAVSDVNAEIPTGVGVGAWGTTDTPTIAFNNSTTVNQDGCQNAQVAIVYTII